MSMSITIFAGTRRGFQMIVVARVSKHGQETGDIPSFKRAIQFCRHRGVRKT